jgi:hypothetical protein
LGDPNVISKCAVHKRVMGWVWRVKKKVLEECRVSEEEFWQGHYGRERMKGRAEKLAIGRRGLGCISKLDGIHVEVGNLEAC